MQMPIAFDIKVRLARTCTKNKKLNARNNLIKAIKIEKKN